MPVRLLAFILPALLSGALSGAAQAGAQCRDLRFPVYFAQGATAVSDAAERALSQAAGQVAGCPVREVVLIPEAALAERDSRGPALADARLSAVARALAAAGIDRNLIRAAPDGPDGPQLPLPPRVTVQVRVEPEHAGANPAGHGYFAALAEAPRSPRRA